MNKLLLVFCTIVLVLSSVMMTACDNSNEDIIDQTVETTITDFVEDTVTEPIEETVEVEEPEEEEEYVEEAEWVYDENLKPEENIFIYLTDYLGFSDAAACGIVANIAYETGWKFNPDVGDINHGAYGLIQWMDGRRRNLKRWCDENGKDYRTIQGQMDFMYWELVNDDPYGTFDRLMQVDDSKKGAYDAGWYFCYWYERPNRKKKASVWRGNEAKDYYEMFVLNSDDVE